MRGGIVEKARKYVMAGGTFAVAIGIGFFMQQGDAAAALDDIPAPDVSIAASLAPTLTSPTPVSASTALTSSLRPIARPSAPVQLASAPAPDVAPTEGIAAQDDIAVASVDVPVEDAAVAENAIAAEACIPTLNATEGTAAMVTLTLRAPCHVEQTLTLHHQGMMATLKTDAAGRAVVEAPALAANAVFIASFDSGESAVAQINVASLDFFDRVVVQWVGDAGFELHAMENGSTYGDPGHVWSDAARDYSVAARGEGGFLTRLGVAEGDSPRLAEVYTYPSGMVSATGVIELSVEAEITQANCGSEVEAQTLQITQAQPVLIRDLVLSIPGCEAEGSFMVMRNLVNDLVLASY